MNARGHTLVEMMVVIGIIAVLLGIGALNFHDYSRRYRGEAQIRMIYGEILKARSDAICQRREIQVKVYPARFEIYSTGSDGSAPARTLPLSLPVLCTKAGPDGGYTIQFDSRGITSNWCTIYLPPGTGSSAVNSVVVSYARVRLDK